MDLPGRGGANQSSMLTSYGEPPRGDTQLFRYRMSGLTVMSEIELTGCIPEAPGDETIDVQVRISPVPDVLEPPVQQWLTSIYNAKTFVMDVPGLGKIAAINGSDLLIFPLAGVCPTELVPALLGSAFAALVYQRGGYLLHASAVIFQGRAHLVCGSSGMGKSTLSAALAARGSAVHCDDQARLALGQQVRVYGDGRKSKLRRDSMAATGVSPDFRCPVGSNGNKYYVDVRHHDSQELVPVAAIYSLSVGSAEDAPRLERLAPGEACAELHNRTFRRAIAMFLLGGQKVTQTAASLAARPGVWRVTRPQNLLRLPELTDLLVDHWNELKPIQT